MKHLSLSLILLLAVVSTAHAQDNSKKDYYDIELILFEQADGYSYEKWPTSPGEPNIALAKDNLSRLSPRSIVTALPQANNTLGPLVYTLNRKNAKVAAYVNVRLPIPKRGTHEWYWIGKNQLQGLIKITKGRYLHIETDLLLNKPDSSHPYRIQLHRRMRSNELHYIDHPMAGLIALAKRYEPEEIIEEAPTETLPEKMFNEEKEAAPEGLSAAKTITEPPSNQQEVTPISR